MRTNERPARKSRRRPMASASGMALRPGTQRGHVGKRAAQPVEHRDTGIGGDDVSRRFPPVRRVNLPVPAPELDGGLAGPQCQVVPEPGDGGGRKVRPSADIGVNASIEALRAAGWTSLMAAMLPAPKTRSYPFARKWGLTPLPSSAHGKGRTTMKTRAAVAWKAGQPLEVVTVDLEGPKAGEVLVEIKATGICHTDEFTRSGARSGRPVPGDPRPRRRGRRGRRRARA